MGDFNLIPNARTIALVYFFFHHYMKGSYPFSIWWLILIFGLDLLIAILIDAAADKFKKGTS